MNCGLVILDGEVPLEHLHFELFEVLNQYDSGLRVKPRLVQTSTDLIKTQRETDAVKFKLLSSYFQADPVGFVDRHGESFVEYVLKRLPEYISQPDEQVHKRAIKEYVRDDSITVDAAGDLYTTKNPKGKFSSWVTGGAFKHAILNTDGSSDDKGELNVKGCDILRRHQLTMMAPFNIMVSKDGEWADRWEYEEKFRTRPNDEDAENVEDGEDGDGFDDFTYETITSAGPEDWLVVIDFDILKK